MALKHVLNVTDKIFDWMNIVLMIVGIPLFLFSLFMFFYADDSQDPQKVELDSREMVQEAIYE